MHDKLNKRAALVLLATCAFWFTILLLVSGHARAQQETAMTLHEGDVGEVEAPMCLRLEDAKAVLETDVTDGFHQAMQVFVERKCGNGELLVRLGQTLGQYDTAHGTFYLVEATELQISQGKVKVYIISLTRVYPKENGT